MPLVLNFGPSLENLRPQETFYSKLTLEGLDEDGRTDAVMYSAYALSPPDFRVAAPCTMARVLHQDCAKGFLWVVFSKATEGCWNLARGNSDFQESKHPWRQSLPSRWIIPLLPITWCDNSEECFAVSQRIPRETEPQLPTMLSSSLTHHVLTFLHCHLLFPYFCFWGLTPGCAPSPCLRVCFLGRPNYDKLCLGLWDWISVYFWGFPGSM